MRNHIAIPKASTSQKIEVYLEDGAGAPVTGLAFGDMTIAYMRHGAAGEVAITPVTMTLGTWASGGFVEVDATNLPGVYQIGLPDAVAADASTSPSYAILLVRASGIENTLVHIDLLEHVYHADVSYRVDEDNEVDEYTVLWFRDGQRMGGAPLVTLATLAVVTRDNASLLIDTMTEGIGGAGFLYNAEGAERLPAGKDAVAQVTALIDGVTREWSTVIGRDTT